MSLSLSNNTTGVAGGSYFETGGCYIAWHRSNGEKAIQSK